MQRGLTTTLMIMVLGACPAVSQEDDFSGVIELECWPSEIPDLSEYPVLVVPVQVDFDADEMVFRDDVADEEYRMPFIEESRNYVLFWFPATNGTDLILLRKADWSWQWTYVGADFLNKEDGTWEVGNHRFMIHEGECRRLR